MDDTTNEYIDLLFEKRGGVISLAELGATFQLKRDQLEAAGYVLGQMNEKGQRNVAPPGHPAPPPPDHVAKPASADKKPTGEEPAAATPMEDSTAEEISELLTKAGEPIPMKLISAIFQVKKEQLELSGFVVGEKNETGARNVALPGSDVPEAPPVVLSSAPSSTSKKRKLEALGAAPSGDPTAELTEEQVLKITDTLMQAGGFTNAARLCQTFRVQRSQLEQAGFVIGPSNSQGQRYVGVLGGDALEAPPVEHKRQSAQGKGCGHGGGYAGKGKGTSGPWTMPGKGFGKPSPMAMMMMKGMWMKGMGMDPWSMAMMEGSPMGKGPMMWSKGMGEMGGWGPAKGKYGAW